MSIRARIFSAFVAVALAIVGVTGLMIYFSSRSEIMSGVNEQLLSMADLQKLRVDEWLGGYRELAGVLVAQPAFRQQVAEALEHPAAWPAVSRWLTGAETGALNVPAIDVVDPAAGNLVLASSDSGAIGHALPYPLPELNGNEGGAPAKGRIEIVPRGTTGESAVLAVAQAIPDEGSMVLVLEGDLQRLAASLVRSGRFGRSGETILGSVGPDGRLIVLTRLRYRKVPILQPMEWIPPESPMSQAFRGEIQGLLPNGSLDYRGVPVLAAAYPISQAPWSVVVQIDHQEAMAPLARLSRTLAGAVLLGATLAAFLSLLIARSLVRPLHLLAGTAERNEPVPAATAGRTDELGSLARALAAREEANRQSRAELDATLATLEDRVAERTRQLRQLTIELNQAEQRERRRLSHLLHDHLQQLLVAARMRLQLVGPGLPPERLQTARDEMGKLLDEAIASSRSLAVELNPPALYEGDFAGALRWLADRMQAQHGLRVEVEAPPGNGARLTETTRVFLFQAARELLFNVVKHAGVDRAQVGLKLLQGWAEMTVEDRGKGIAPEAAGGGGTGPAPEAGAEPAAGGAAPAAEAAAGGVHFGLFSIREQIQRLGGRFAIESRPGQGTRITLALPIGPAGPSAGGSAG